MKKEYKKYTVNKVGTLYHLSEKNLGGRMLKPSRPFSVYQDEYGHLMEDKNTARLCLASTMSGAFRAISFTGMMTELYVHVLVNKDELVKDGKIIRPNEDMVYDCKFTGEYWSVGKSELKCIGKAFFCYDENVPFYRWRPLVRIKWIEKY